MNKKYKKSLFVFHRDLRLEDNVGLIKALEQSAEVFPVFIFTPQQINKNSYKSEFSLHFMVQSLRELAAEIRKKSGELSFFFGKTDEVIDRLIRQEGIEAVFSNRDYTPFAIARDEQVLKVCQNNRVALKIYEDALLTAPEAVHKPDGKPYTVFTPFFKRAQHLPIASPQKNMACHYGAALKGSDMQWLSKMQPKLKGVPALQGGRVEGLKLVKEIKNLHDYKVDRNIPSLEKGTSRLSAHHKFGTVSIRESFYAAISAHGPDHHFISELFWRDFMTHIAFHFPHVFQGAFRPQYNQIQWSNGEEDFQRWCEGKTGFPIVDAGMRQLNATGFMHNRARMIVASFLVKDLHINWQWGEKYFAQRLIDYDPAVNNGSWQWAASTGCDAQPYFRIFNPWLQQKKFDPEAVYIKKWVSELKLVEPDVLHRLYDRPVHIDSYPAPMVQHKTASLKAKMLFKTLK